MYFRHSSKRPWTGLLIIGAFAGALAACDARAADTSEVTDVPTETGHYALGLSNSFRATQGKFDPYGAYQAYPDGSTVWALSHAFSLSDRFTHAWEASLGFSIRESEAHYPSGAMSSRSVGNPSVDVRFHPAPRGSIVHWIAHAGVGIPLRTGNRVITGDPTRDSSSSSDPLSDGTNGADSGWNLRMGLGALKRIDALNLRAAVDASVGVPLSSQTYGDGSDGPTSAVMRARTYMLSEGLAYLATSRWSVHGGFRQQWAGLSSVDGTPVSGTASRVFSSNLGVEYSAGRDWLVSTTYSTPFPFYSYLANQPYAPTVSVALGYSGI